MRDGRIVEYDLSPPFDILFGMPRFENGSLVEVAGIEPASFGTDTGLLRAQPAALFSASPFTQASW